MKKLQEAIKEATLTEEKITKSIKGIATGLERFLDKWLDDFEAEGWGDKQLQALAGYYFDLKRNNLSGVLSQMRRTSTWLKNV